jgi:hypothetical protein
MKKGLTATSKYTKFMKYLLPALVSILILTQCAPTDTVSEPDSVEPEAETEYAERFGPEWYEPGVSSETDTTALYGYSHSIAAEEAKARETAEEMAMVNLRFEMDRYAEEIRRELEEQHGSTPFGERTFIIDLRNALQDIDLSSAQISYDTAEEDGLHHIFIQASLSLESAHNLLRAKIDQEEFVRKLSSEDRE